MLSRMQPETFHWMFKVVSNHLRKKQYVSGRPVSLQEVYYCTLDSLGASE